LSSARWHSRVKRDPFTNVPLNALRAFECLARCGSHTAAAAELGVTVSALSHQIRKLEQHVGASLVVSNGRRLALTPDGEELAAAVGDGFSRVRESLSSIGRVRSLKLAVCPLFGALLAPRWVALEAKAGERLELSLSALPQLSQAIDAAVCLRAAELSRHNSIDVFTGEAAPVATPPVRDLAARGTGAPPWLLCTRWDDAVTQWWDAAGLSMQPRNTIRTEGLSGLYAACMRGVGPAILPLDLIRDELRAGVLVEVFPESSRLGVSIALHFSSGWLHVDRMRRLAQALGQTASRALNDG